MLSGHNLDMVGDFLEVLPSPVGVAILGAGFDDELVVGDLLLAGPGLDVQEVHAVLLRGFGNIITYLV